MPIDLYCWPTSITSRSVLMTVKLLSIDVNVIKINVIKGENYSPEYRKVNPMQKLPTIVDNDNDLVVWESRAIMRYLVNKYAPNSYLYPREPKERAFVDEWLDFELCLSHFIYTSSMRKPSLEVVLNEDRRHEYRERLKLLDSMIGDREYLVGDGLTLADISLVSLIAFLSEMPDNELDSCSHLMHWWQNVRTVLPEYEVVFMSTKLYRQLNNISTDSQSNSQ